MGSGNVVDYVGSAIKEYVENRDDVSRMFVEQAIQSSGILNDKQNMEELNRQLEETGLLPKLLQQELSEIDTWHVSINPFSDIQTGTANRALEKSEMQDVVDNAEDYRAATVLAAQFGLKNYDRIKASGNFGQEWLRYGISSDMIDKYMRRQDENGKTISADEVFSGDTESRYEGGFRTFFGFNAYGERANPFDSVNPHPGSDADLPRGYAAVNGKPARVSDTDEYRNSYQFGDREVTQQIDGNWAYTVKSGDTLDRVSRAILRDHMGSEPDESEVRYLTQQLAKRNGIKDVNKVRIDDTLVIPDIWGQY